MKIIHEVMLKQSNQEGGQLMTVTFLIRIVLFISLLVLKMQSLEELYHTQILNIAHTFTLGMTRVVPLTINSINGLLRSCFIIKMK